MDAVQPPGKKIASLTKASNENILDLSDTNSFLSSKTERPIFLAFLLTFWVTSSLAGARRTQWTQPIKREKRLTSDKEKTSGCTNEVYKIQHVCSGVLDFQFIIPES